MSYICARRRGTDYDMWSRPSEMQSSSQVCSRVKQCQKAERAVLLTDPLNELQVGVSLEWTPALG